MRKVLKLVSLLLTPMVVTTAMPSVATAQTVDLLGTREVNFAVDRDRIDVGGQEGVFRGIVFEVIGNGIEVLDATVTFGNGNTQDLQVRQFIAAGQRSRIIDLNANRRFIRSIQFLYRTRGVNVGRATVRVYGVR